VVGIIGRNGAGKSTLLKVLSRITRPTRGAVDLFGRIGSLLEVGTGFHPELSGRENIYLNGTIIGMRRSEIVRSFDEIVDFAGIEKFLDTPVKRYSSGMYVRLAFAVAAHLNPEILVVDEVLAVGDAQFQKKCLGKMKEVATGGRTILFVSHNMAAVTNLCSRGILLRRGKVVFDGATKDAVEEYSKEASRSRTSLLEGLDEFRPAWARPAITAVRLVDDSGTECSAFSMGCDISLEVDFALPSGEELSNPNVGVVLRKLDGTIVGGVNMSMTGTPLPEVPVALGRARGTLRSPALLQGFYTVDVWLSEGRTDVDCLEAALSLEIQETDVYGTGVAPNPTLGVVYLSADWELMNLRR